MGLSWYFKLKVHTDLMLESTSRVKQWLVSKLLLYFSASLVKHIAHCVQLSFSNANTHLKCFSKESWNHEDLGADIWLERRQAIPEAGQTRKVSERFRVFPPYWRVWEFVLLQLIFTNMSLELNRMIWLRVRCRSMQWLLGFGILRPTSIVFFVWITKWFLWALLMSNASPIT